MDLRNLYCDNCGQEATVFALHPPAKIKACRMHIADLMEKYSTIFKIAAYDFIETAEDLSEFETRRNISQKCQGSLTALRERCASNRNEATSRLQAAKEDSFAVVERSYQEMQMQVDQRYEKINEELNALSASLEKLTSDKHHIINPALAALSDSTPSGDLFRVVQGDCSLSLATMLMDHSVLLPADEGVLRMDAGKKVMEKVKALVE